MRNIVYVIQDEDNCKEITFEVEQNRVTYKDQLIITFREVSTDKNDNLVSTDKFFIEADKEKLQYIANELVNK